MQHNTNMYSDSSHIFQKSEEQNLYMTLTLLSWQDNVDKYIKPLSHHIENTVFTSFWHVNNTISANNVWEIPCSDNIKLW